MPRAANCPQDLPSNPSYWKVNPSDSPIMILALTSKTQGKERMFDVADSIVSQKIAQVEGIGEVDVGAVRSPLSACRSIRKS